MVRRLLGVRRPATRVARLPEVAGQFGDAAYWLPLEGFSGAAMEATALLGAEGVVDAARGQHMTEPRPAVAVLVH